MRYPRFASASQRIDSGLGARSAARRRRTASAWWPRPARTPARKSAAMRASHRLGAAVGVEARDVEPERSARAHRCGSSSRPWSANSASCIAQNAPAGRPPRPRRRRPGARVAGADREVPERDPQRQLAQPQLERRAERALVVAVDDHQARRLRPPHVIGGADGRERCGAEVAQAACRARRRSGSRRAGRRASRPRSSTRPRRRGRSAPARAAGSRRGADAERAAGGALGLEVRELLDLDAELLLERLLGAGRVAGDAVERRALRRRSRRAARCRRSSWSVQTGENANG